MWSKEFPSCQECGKDDSPHMAKGLCKRCYGANYRAVNKERIYKQRDEWYQRFHADNLLKMARNRRKSQYDGLWESILKRDGHKCVRCGSDMNLIVHHKDRSGRGKTEHNNNPANLETLCRSCHLKEHRAEHPPKRPRKPSGRWSLKHECCRECGTTKIHHSAFGLCRTCIARRKRSGRKTDLE